MNVAIIGCGKISEEHAWVIQKIPDAKLVGVCDSEPLMAAQMAERFQVPEQFSDAREMLARIKPNVVHITTSPQSHFELGRMCLESGCNVLIEKPFTLTGDEADVLVRLAQANSCKLTAGHDHQCCPAALEMRRLVNDGFLGGAPVHLESLFPYDMGDERYARALLKNRSHWVRQLPGKLAHNVISHGISKIAEFMKSESPEVSAIGFQSAALKKAGETEIIDELRVMIRDSNDTTAYFTFSSQMKPGMHQLRMHGPKQSLLVDYTHQAVIPIGKRAYKSYLNQFIPPLEYGIKAIKSGFRNMRRFTKNEFHQDAGRRHLVRQFYDAIEGNAPLPLTYNEIICTARIMDSIFAQVFGDPRRTLESDCSGSNSTVEDAVKLA